MRLSPILKRSSHTRLFRAIWEDCYFMSRAGGFQLALVTLLFAPREGILQHIWLIWPQGSSIRINFPPSFFCGKEENSAVTLMIQSPPFYFVRRKRVFLVWCLQDPPHFHKTTTFRIFPPSPPIIPHIFAWQKANRCSSLLLLFAKFELGLWHLRWPVLSRWD